MTAAERQQLSQFASDNGLCITLDGGAIVDVSANETWRPMGQRLVSKPYRMMDLDGGYFVEPARIEIAADMPGERRRKPTEIARRRKASKAARKARKNRR